MTDVVARIKVKGKPYEILVDCDKALAFKKQKIGSMQNILAVDMIFSDQKKGLKAPHAELKDAFNTEDVYAIAEKIITSGEILLPQEYRDKAREQKIKQVIDFLARNCVDPRTGAPYTAQRIEQALKQVSARIEENRSAEDQALEIMKEMTKLMPIKIETKRIKVTIPPAYTGKLYGLLKSYNAEKEEWLNDGSLSCVINLPAGLQLEFYDKLNNATHGAAITQEIKQ